MDRREYEGTIVDAWPTMVYRPGLVYALTDQPTFVRRYRINARTVCERAGFRFLEGRAVAIDPERQRVYLTTHHPVPYDVLFLATGSDPGWTTIPGLNVSRGGLCEDYLARHTAQERSQWPGGRVVWAAGPLRANPRSAVQQAVADEFMLYESCLLWDAVCRRSRTRERTTIRFLTPASVLGEALGPKGQSRLQRIMAERAIEVKTGVTYRRVTEAGIQLADGFVPADGMIWLPPYVGSGLARDSGLDDGYGWVPVTAHLQHPQWPTIYAVGDITTHVPKLAHGAMVQARVAVHHWAAQIHHKPLLPPYHPQVVALIDIGQGQGFFSLNTTLLGGDRDWVYVGRLAQMAKKIFNQSYVRFHSKLPIMP